MSQVGQQLDALMVQEMTAFPRIHVAGHGLKRFSRGTLKRF